MKGPLKGREMKDSLCPVCPKLPVEGSRLREATQLAHSRNLWQGRGKRFDGRDTRQLTADMRCGNWMSLESLD